MYSEIRNWISKAKEKLHQEPIQKADLDILETLIESFSEPTIMYLTARSTDLRSGIIGWVTFDPFKEHKPTLPSTTPPYNSVLEAVADGWRIVQYPIAKLYEYKELENDYVGFDFILEKHI